MNQLSPELPLSFSQERIWALSRIKPENISTGNMFAAFRIKGELNISFLGKSINEIVRRHQALRTACKTIRERPVQSIVSEVKSSFSFQELKDVSEVEKETKQTFDLEKPPFLKAKLFRVRENEYILLIATHLYTFDGLSRSILNHEISELYNAFSRGKKSPLPELKSQYIDFVKWHRKWFEGDNFEKQKNYWIKKLAGANILLDFPFANSRDKVTSRRTEALSFTIPGFLSESVREIAGSEKTTLFMILMAAFQTLLHSYTGQEDISVGTIVSNRNRAEAEKMIGSFSNNILIRSDFASIASFGELIDQVRGTMTEAYANQDIPFEKLIGKLDRAINRTPLFGTMFVYHKVKNKSLLNLSGLKIENFKAGDNVSQHELNLVITDNGKTYENNKQLSL